jgi:hypothetical protein
MPPQARKRQPDIGDDGFGFRFHGTLSARESNRFWQGISSGSGSAQVRAD